MANKANILRHGPGVDDRLSSLPVEDNSVVIDRKRNEAVYLIDDETDYIRGKRLSPFDRKMAIHVHFAGDGESLVVGADATDYRNVEEYDEQLDEDTVVRRLRIEAVGLIRRLTFTARKAACLRARETRRNPQQDQAMMLTTLTAVVVAVVLLLIVMTYVSNNGGLSETIFPTSPEVQTGDADGPVGVGGGEG